MGNLDLPFEPNDLTNLTDTHAHVASGVVVMAAVVAGYPALVFRFAIPDGSGFYPPVVLALSESHQPDALRHLIDQSLTHAVQVAAAQGGQP